MEQKTGLASVDKPWLSLYSDSGDEFDAIPLQGKTVWDVMEVLLEKHSDIPLIEYFGNIISRESFRKYVITWAKAFKACRVETDEIIPVFAPATPETFAIFFAANVIGATPYYQRLDITEQALEDETSEAKVAVVFDGFWNKVSGVFSNERFQHVFIISASDSMPFLPRQIIRLKDVFGRKKEVINRIPNTPKYVRTDHIERLAGTYRGEYKAVYKEGRGAVITASSGTTSHAVKGIMDTNESVLQALICSLKSDSMGFGKGKRMFTCFPLTASTSLNCEHLLPAFAGCTIVLDPRADISLWYHQLMKNKPDIAVTTGSVWELFVRQVLENEKIKGGGRLDLSWADYLIMGGSGTTPEILDWVNRVLLERGVHREIKVGYGLSEVFGVLTVNPYEKEHGSSTKPVNSVGVPMKGYTAAVFDENGKELPYGKGHRGELWIQSPSVMHGYYNKPEETEAAMKGTWLRSGDLCEMDEYGFVYCYGRLTNAITIEGRRTYLFDIANDIREHFQLHDVLVEKKKLIDGKQALNMYFVQKSSGKRDRKTLMTEMDEYLSVKNTVINGYKEHTDMLPVDPTTIKPRTKDTDGFRKFIQSKEHSVSYVEREMDVYEEIVRAV